MVFLFEPLLELQPAVQMKKSLKGWAKEGSLPVKQNSETQISEDTRSSFVFPLDSNAGHQGKVTVPKSERGAKSEMLPDCCGRD